MARDFYPFVEEGQDGPAREGSAAGLEVTHPARVAVYDDAAAAPRVVVIEPQDVRSYLEEITRTVSTLAREQGGTIPFMVIREIVENFVHAYFRAPTITILDGGDTIRFSDQGPGIREKDRALEYGTTSATEEMKRYIRGVGSGLPYAQQYMEDKGGSLEIEDNISGGTVVTISTRPARDARAQAHAAGAHEDADTAPAAGPAQPYGWPQQPAAPGWGWAQQPQQQWPAQPYPPQPYQQPYPQPYQQPPYQPQAAAPQGAPGAWPQGPAGPGTFQAQVTLDERGRQALALVVERGAAGPTDLVQAYGSSAATWSRALAALAAQGAVTKVGQKYHPTEFGRQVAQMA